MVKKLLLTVVMLWSSAHVNALTITVMTTTAYPIQGTMPNVPVEVYYLDDIHKIISMVNKNPHCIQSQKCIRRFFKSHRVQMINALKGIQQAAAMNIRVYPAVIFDDQYVVLGTTNVNKALWCYSRWKLTHRHEVK